MILAQSMEHLLSSYYITVLSARNTRLKGMMFPIRKTGNLIDIPCTKVSALKDVSPEEMRHILGFTDLLKEVKSDLSLGG